MKTLEQIKNEFAVSKGYRDWESLMIEVCYFSNEEFFKHENKVMKIYARECLKLASENAYIEPMGMMTRVDKYSITNENNIIK